MRPRPLQQQACAQLGRLRDVETTVEQSERVGDRGPPHRRLPGEQPAVGGPLDVAGRERVRRHRLGPVGGQVGRTPVVGRGQRRWQRGVNALLDQVVDELVAALAAHQQPDPGQLLAVPHDGQLVGPGQVGQLSRVEPPAQHGPGPEHVAHRGVEPVLPRVHRIGQRRGDPGVAGGQGAQALDDAERMTGGALHDRRTVHPEARRCGQCVHRRPGQRGEPHDGGPVGQHRDESRVLGADRPDDQHGRVPEPLGQVAEQVDGRGAAVLQVVDGQQHRRPLGQPAQDGRHPVVRTPALEVGRAGRASLGDDQGAQLGQQPDPRVCVVLHQPGHRGGRRVEEHRAERVDVGLEEQRALGRMAPRAQDGPARPAGQLGRGLQQPGLPDPGLTLDEQQATGARTRGGPGPPHERQLGLAPDQRRSSCGPRAVLGRGPGVPEHREVQLGRGTVRVRAELVAQPPGEGVVRRQGRRRAAGRHLGAHQGPAGALVERVTLDRFGGDTHRLRRVDDRQRRGEQPASACAQRVGLPPYALDPVGVRLVEKGVLGTEQVEGPAGRGGAEAVLARRQPVVGLVEQPAGLVQVDRPGSGADQAVGAARRTGQRVTEEPTGAADQGRDVGCRVRRRVVRPEHGDDPVHGDQPATLGREQGEQGARLAAAEFAPLDRAAVQVDRDRRAQPDADRIGHGHPLETLPCSIRRVAGVRQRCRCRPARWKGGETGRRSG